MSTCRQIHRLLLAEPDGTLGADEQARLASHLAVCPACRRQRAILGQTPGLFREADVSVTVPDPGSEWRALQRRLRPPESSGGSLARRLMPWSLTLAAGAAACLAVVVWRGATPTVVAPLARAEYVQAEGSDSTLVYVDEESGWLIVWADRRPGGPTG